MLAEYHDEQLPQSDASDTPLPSMDDIKRLQQAMLPHAVNPPDPSHFFAPGMYMRELTVPAGMLVVGKIHKHDHFLIVTKGRAIVASVFGREEVTAGHLSVSKAGVKRVVLAIEDTQFVTIHANATDTQDLDAIESAHIEHEQLAMPSREVQEALQ